MIIDGLLERRIACKRIGVLLDKLSVGCHLTRHDADTVCAYLGLLRNAIEKECESEADRTSSKKPDSIAL